MENNDNLPVIEFSEPETTVEPIKEEGLKTCTFCSNLVCPDCFVLGHPSCADCAVLGVNGKIPTEYFLKSQELQKNKVGRPTSFTQDLADRICQELSYGKSLRKVCEHEDMPCAATVFNWLATNKDFLEQYTQAKEASSEAMNEMLIDIGDEAIEKAQEVNEKVSGAVVQAYKLKADNMKWYMSKVKPKKYGEKVDVTSDGKAIKGNTIIFGEFSNETDSQ